MKPLIANLSVKDRIMIRKMLAVMLLAIAIGTLAGAIPGFLETVAHACELGDPGCP